MQNLNLTVKDLIGAVQKMQDKFRDRAEPPDKSPIVSCIKRPLMQTISLRVNRNDGEVSAHFSTTVESFLSLQTYDNPTS